MSDFTIDRFVHQLNSDDELPVIESVSTPFGQVTQVLLDNSLEYWKNNPDFAIIWTQPATAIHTFNSLLHFDKVSLKDILQEVDKYCALLLNICDKVNLIFVPSWVLPPFYRGLGMLDMKYNTGITNVLMQMNLRLSLNFDKESNIYLLNTSRWISTVGEKAFNPKLWYMGKMIFEKEVFIEVIKDVKSALRGAAGSSKKMIVLDLDDTLWSGTVGEIGWKTLVLGGHDPIGEALVDFQKALKSFVNRGIMLGIVSKNEESVALEAINSHPEMVLKLSDFAGWKINWGDKARNIIDLVSELNMGLQSVVYIDDNPVERAYVRETLPEVLVPEWPKDKMLYKKALMSLTYFDTPFISKEDIERTKMYVTDRKRQHLKIKNDSVDKWLSTLETRVKIEDLNDANLQRIIQLLNKTNQMNLTTRRMTESELLRWAKNNDNKLWAFRAMDKFGELGLIGIISLEIQDKVGKITDFILSCRALGRKIEEVMIYTAIMYARSKTLNKVYAKYLATPKNKPCLEFWKKTGFKHYESDDHFEWAVENDFIFPKSIQVQGEIALEKKPNPKTGQV